MLHRIVLRITVTIDEDEIVVEKRGLFRRSRFAFATSQASFHYYRTHYRADRAWLQLVVREDETFFLLFAWRGTGNQRDRFFELLARLKAVLATYQNSGDK